MRNLWLSMIVCSFLGTSFAQTPLGASSVWQVPQDFVSKAHAVCDRSAMMRSFEECVMAQMPQAGAPEAAVNFTRELFDQNREVGIMTSFQKVGPVDVAWVTYPLRADHHFGLLLVNGQPRLVNAEDLKLLDEKGMRQSFQFGDIRNQFPKAELFPGDRDGTTWPNSQTGPNGGLQFTLGYPLRNGCPTCAHAGFALFNWNFDPKGKFTGTSFMGFTPPPLPGS